MERRAWLLSLCVLMGCPGGEGGPDAAPCELEVSWGPRRAGEFRPFVDGDRAEITLGFQGFRYIMSSLRFDADHPDDADVWFQVQVAGHEPYALRQRMTLPAEEPDGWRYRDDVLVFFNDIPIPDLIDQEAAIVIRAEAGGCEGLHGATVRLADDDGCVEQADGGLTCE